MREAWILLFVFAIVEGLRWVVKQVLLWTIVAPIAFVLGSLIVLILRVDDFRQRHLWRRVT